MSVDDEQPAAESVNDQDGHLKQRRLSDIHEARRNVREVVNKVEEAKLTGTVSEQQANTYIRRAVENYIREIRYPLKNTEEGRKYWEKKKIGTLTINPPSPAQLAWRHKLKNEIGHPRPGRRDTSQIPGEYTLRSSPSALEPRTVSLVGLNSLFDAPNPIQTTYSLRFSVRFRDTITVRETMEKQIPQEVLMEFFDIAIDASGDIGLEADLNDEDGDAGFDIEDVDEVDLE